MRPARSSGIACTRGIPAADDSRKSTSQLYINRPNVGVTVGKVRHVSRDQHGVG